MALPELPVPVSPNPPPQVDGEREGGAVYQTQRGPKDRENPRNGNVPPHHQTPDVPLRYEEE